MSFLALEFDANAADAERWADALLDAGALAVDTADPHAGSDREIARYGEPNGISTPGSTKAKTLLPNPTAIPSSAIVQGDGLVGNASRQKSAERIPSITAWSTDDDGAVS